MNKKTIGGIVISALLLSGGIALGSWLQRPTLQELADRNNALARQDTVRQITLDNLTTAYRKLSFDFVGADSLNKRLEKLNAALARDLNNNKATILSLTEVNTTLTERLEGESQVTRRDSALLVEVEETKMYDRGHVSLEGTVLIPDNSDKAQTTFDLMVVTTPVLVYSRNPDGTAEVTLDFGDMPIRVDRLEGAQNLDDPIREMVRTSFPEIAWKVGLGAVGISALVLIILK